VSSSCQTLRAPALPVTQPAASKHWTQCWALTTARQNHPLTSSILSWYNDSWQKGTSNSLYVLVGSPTLQWLLKEGYIELPLCTGGLSNITMTPEGRVHRTPFMYWWALQHYNAINITIHASLVAILSRGQYLLWEPINLVRDSAQWHAHLRVLLPRLHHHHRHVGVGRTCCCNQMTSLCNNATSQQRLLITHASQAPPASLITASPSHCSYVDRHVTQTPTGCVVVWNNSRLGRQHCASAWQRNHNNVSHG